MSGDFVEDCLLSCDFGDIRRNLAGFDFVNSIMTQGSLVVKSLSADRAEQVRFQRFLWNRSVSIDELLNQTLECTKRRAKDSDHVLAIQDTSEIALSRQDDLDPELGLLKNRELKGFYVHPVLALDPKDDFVVGLAGHVTFDYGSTRVPYEGNSRSCPIEEKKSYRWLSSAFTARNCLSNTKCTVVGDRESDIYEFYSRVPNDHTDVLTRAKKGRKVSLPDEDKLFPIEDVSQYVDCLGRISVSVRARGAVAKGVSKKLREARKEREAELEVRFCEVRIKKTDGCGEQDPDELTLYLVEAKEKAKGIKDPIHWMLLTTHKVHKLEKALEIIQWYQKRWHIEQLFRTAKRHGMRIEEMEASKKDSVEKLAFLGLLASVKTLQLTICRDGLVNRDAKILFSDTEIEIMDAMQSKLEGSTENLQNPHEKYTVAWAHWTIARMGRWMGKSKYGGPAGPKCIKRGLDRLAGMVEGWELFQDKNVCIT